MADPFLVRGFECIENLAREGERVFDRDWTSAHPFGERLPLNQFEDQVALTIGLGEVIDRGDVGMIQGSDGLRLTMESRDAIGILRMRGRQNLDGDLSIELGVLGSVDLAHATCPEQIKDFKGAESRAGCEAQARLS